jgi:hypothetical protein
MKKKTIGMFICVLMVIPVFPGTCFSIHAAETISSNLSHSRPHQMSSAYGLIPQSDQFVHYTEGELVLLDQNSSGAFRVMPILHFIAGVSGVVTFH